MYNTSCNHLKQNFSCMTEGPLSQNDVKCVPLAHITTEILLSHWSLALSVKFYLICFQQLVSISFRWSKLWILLVDNMSQCSPNRIVDWIQVWFGGQFTGSMNSGMFTDKKANTCLLHLTAPCLLYLIYDVTSLLLRPDVRYTVLVQCDVLM